MIEVMSKRAIGQLPISIGTGLAIEALCGIGEGLAVSTPAIKAGQVLYINLRTLIRNAVESYPSDITPDADVITSTVMDDLKNIHDAFKTYISHPVTVKVYYPSYARLPAKFNRSLLRVIKSEKQERLNSLTISVSSNLQKKLGNFLIQCDITLPAAPENIILMSNYPVDLLSRYQFSDMQLLESHTGLLKPPSEWNSKLYGDTVPSNMPFNAITLQIFGDKVMFKPMLPSIKKVFIEMAKRERWTIVTTKSRIIDCVKKLREPALEVLVRDLDV